MRKAGKEVAMDGDILEMQQNFEDVADELGSCEPQDLNELTDVAVMAQEAITKLLTYIKVQMAKAMEAPDANKSGESTLSQGRDGSDDEIL
jgi:hypothetical protein